MSDAFGVKMGEIDQSSPAEPSSRSARQKRIGVHRIDFLPIKSATAQSSEGSVQQKKQKTAAEETTKPVAPPLDVNSDFLKFGFTSIRGRRGQMEDTVAIHPSLGGRDLDFFGVYDGHGCSHVAFMCRDRMHEIVEDEIQNRSPSSTWEQTMSQSFLKMDKEVGEYSGKGDKDSSVSFSCRCRLQIPLSDAVGSTAVVAVISPEKIVISNCGDSRAVLCRNGFAIPLSMDQKPDRPDELNRIEKAGGKVAFWDGARVLGVLAMSRAIGDIYLKPYVIPVPEVTAIDRTSSDECLILASDGLWDVVSDETACGVARMCLRSQQHGGCSDASVLLTKLALARHSSDNISVVVVDLRNV